MREDDFPRPVSDPEADGLPETADADSTGWDDVNSGRIADGPDPAMLPGGRDEHPMAVGDAPNPGGLMCAEPSNSGP